MCFLALTLGTTVSCQQAEELTPTLAKDEIANCFSDDRQYCVDVDTETKTATINYFRYNDNSTVVVPSTITYQDTTYTVIGLNQVYKENRDKITSVTLPNTLQTIGHVCFEGTSIKEIDIPNSVISIGEHAFNFCQKLERAKLPSNLAAIPDGLFYECTKLSTVELPQKLKEIGDAAFGCCRSLQKIRLPEGLKKIASQSFCDCTSLKTINLPTTLEEIGYCSFAGCAFESIELPESLTEMDGGVVRGCENLTDIVIPSKISAIQGETFSGCTQLQSVTLGAGVKTIGYSSFYDTTNLKTIKVCAWEPPTFESSDPFTDNQYDNCTLYVPKTSLEAYKKDSQWGKFLNILSLDDEPKASLTDTESTIPEGTYEAGKLTYSRTNEKFAEGKFVTICLPFSINLADADCFSAVYIPKDIALYNPTTKMLTLMMKKASKTTILPAGQPFMAKLSGNTIALKNYSRTYITSTYANDLKANMETKFEVYNYDGSSSVMESNDVIDVRFCGTFSKKEGLDKESYRTFTPEGSFAQDTQVNPFRAYIYKTTTSSSPTLQSLSIATGGVADDILNDNYTIKGDKLIINK